MPQRLRPHSADFQAPTPLDACPDKKRNWKGWLPSKWATSGTKARKGDDGLFPQLLGQTLREVESTPEASFPPEQPDQGSQQASTDLKRPGEPVRHDSEKREKLFVYHQNPHEYAKTVSRTRRRRALSERPAIRSPDREFARGTQDLSRSTHSLTDAREGEFNLGSRLHSPNGNREQPNGNGVPMKGSGPDDDFIDDEQDYDIVDDGYGDELWEELSKKWILNLSMKFKEHRDREKFIITYAQESNLWRRLTVSCDYKNAAPDSLEADLGSLHFQRDKSARIYEAIRESLEEIEFYPTVTNLKLQTTDKRLHVHVTEDINEIIHYPSVQSIRHIDPVKCPRYPETTLNFEAHLSGFVYKVSRKGEIFVKKEIPSPDTVDEFLYEINALYMLQDSEFVIKLRGIVVDESGSLIKGLLLDFADGGALVDILFESRDTDIAWPKRELWAKQIIEGLAEIHEEGFVQGDFTLANVVIDSDDNAKIIDINRRGCPIGWEPPELQSLIRNRQRVSMYIGVKTDLYQLGMVLWALAEQDDQPEQAPDLDPDYMSDDTPAYYREIVRYCLSEQPRFRKAAKDLLWMFPPIDQYMARYNGITDVPPVEEPMSAASGKLEANGVEMIEHEDPHKATRRALSTVNRIFSPPQHQDSGFAEMLPDIPPLEDDQYYYSHPHKGPYMRGRDEHEHRYPGEAYARENGHLFAGLGEGAGEDGSDELLRSQELDI